MKTSAGLLQVGVPPETIKDTMILPEGVPPVFVVTRELFDYERGVSVAEVEFPIFYHYFIRRSRAVIVASAEQKIAICRLIQEAVFGPAEIDLTRELPVPADQCPWLPDLKAELIRFLKPPDGPDGEALTLEGIVDFVLFDDAGVATVGDLTIRREEGDIVTVEDRSLADNVTFEAVSRVTDRPRLRREDPESSVFSAPAFGVTVLGAGHGFDPDGKTTGFVLWIGGRGILVDPPVDTTEWLLEHGISPRRVEAILLTHCHADHDAGCLQRALQRERVQIITTHTILESFLRKSSAITGLPSERLAHIVDFVPVPVRKRVRLMGAEFSFAYTLHSLPTIRFEVWYGGKSLIYSSDTLADPEVIELWRQEGVLSQGRAEALLDFPWDHDLVIHEAGVAPIHTPPALLEPLSDEVKGRLMLVHTTEDAIPSGSGLKLAQAGLDGTISIDAVPPPESRAVRWLDAFRAIEHFRDLPLEKAVQVLEVAEERAYEPGEAIIRRGEPGDHFYIILDGCCRVLFGEVAQKLLEEHEYFGEASLIAGTPRSADVEAATHVNLLIIGKAGYLRLIAQTGIAEQMQRLAANRAERTWTLFDRHPVLSTLNTAQRTRLQAAMVRQEVPEGALLWHSDDVDAPGYLVDSGALQERSLDAAPRLYGAGSFAACIDALVQGESPGAVLRVTTAGTVYRIDAACLREFLWDHPGLYLRLMARRRAESSVEA
ncbi:MAG: cyclic nucleotide-binding domain-containing protein [Myxococcota bacterium]